MSERNDKFDYFMEQTNFRLDKIDSKIDQLLAFKWQIIGGSLVASSVLSILLNTIFQIFGGK